mmetsp:Transcript_866/g.2485  ORF Transcript_866/g.2485 Transcript_866/m.2485 type:complete len:221 (+) Transcript_866:1431-2093(+)
MHSAAGEGQWGATAAHATCVGVSPVHVVRVILDGCPGLAALRVEVAHLILSLEKHGKGYLPCGGRKVAQCVAHEHCAANGPGDVAGDEDEAAVDVNLVHALALHRAAHAAHASCHLLAGPHTAQTQTADRAASALHLAHAVTGRLPLEAVPLHHTREPLALALADHVHQLARQKVLGRQLRAHWQQRVLCHAELGHRAFWFHARGGEVANLRRGHILGTL